MNKSRESNLWFAILAMGIVLLGRGTPVQAAECGKIESLQGPVEILRVKEGQPNQESVVRQALKAVPKLQVDCADVVVTQAKARAKIRLKGNVVLTMGPHSRMSIEEYAQKSGNPTLLHLTYGKMRALFQEGKSEKTPAAGSPAADPKSASQEVTRDSQFRIRTSTAVAGVRGTDFFVSFEPNTRVTEQATITGKVEVEQVGTGQKVTVPAGNQVAVEQVVAAAPAVVSVTPGSTPPSTQAEPAAPAVPLKKLEVKPIDTQVVAEIRQTSTLVKADVEFTSQEAVKVLGAPEKWQPSAKELPFDLKELKEEF